ncbi:MAG: TadE/TadG family type IV pilus assembly protein [Bryobacteraceae bacterium]
MQKASRISRKPDQRGAAMVEGALVLSLFLFLVIGIIDFGQLMFVHQSLTNRAGAGARYAAVRTFDAEAARNVVLYGTANPNDSARPAFGLTAANVNVELQDSNTDYPRVVLTISGYRYHFISPLLARIATGRPITISLPYEQP